MTGRRRLRLALAGLAVIPLAACGTTVAGTAQQAASVAGSGQGLTAPTSSTAGPAPATTGTSSAATGATAAVGSSPAAGAPAATGPAAGTTSSGAAAGGGSASGANAAAVNLPGVTSKAIYVGEIYSTEAGSGDRAAGAAGAAPSYDFRDVFNAVADYANNHGGFAGRKLVPIFVNYNVTTDTNTQDQAACATWTQDNKVLFMPGQSDILRACAEKAGIISLSGGDEVSSTFDRFPHFVDPNGLRFDRLGPVTVNGLYKAGYFTGKLGLITWDAPNYHYAIDHGYRPALASHGLAPRDVEYITVPQQIGALADTSAGVRSAIAKFRADGVDHVIIQDGRAGVFSGTGLTFEFMQQADAQKYYPRYGMNTDNSPGFAILPADQEDKALAILSGDDQPSDDAGWHPNTTREKCFKIEADAGFPVSTSNQNDEGLAAQACDAVFFVQRIVNTTPRLSIAGLMQTISGLGKSFASAFVYGINLFPGRRDGADAVRTAEYFASCKCLKYSGPPYYVG